MRERFQHILKNNYILVIAFITVGLIFHLWLFSTRPIVYGDLLYFYKEYLSSWFSSPLSYIWTTANYLGNSKLDSINQFNFDIFIGFLSSLGLPYQISLRFVYLIPIIIVSFTSIFFLAKQFFYNKVAFIISLLFFLTNTAAIVTFKWPKIGLAYALMPLVFFFCYKLLSTRRKEYFFLFPLVFYCVFIEIRTAFFTFCICGIFLLYYLYLNRREKPQTLLKIFASFLFSCILIFLLGSYIIFPSVFGQSGLAVIGQDTTRTLFGTGFYTLENALTLDHPFWDGKTLQIFTKQPVIMFFWLIPIYAFSALFFIKRNKYILFFSLIALIGVFLGKGTAPPFPTAYFWLYSHVFFFNFVREPSRWWVITAFAYTVLIGCTITYAYQVIDHIFQSQKSSQKKRVLLSAAVKALLAAPIFFVISSIAWPITTGSIGVVFSAIKIPQDYYALKQFLTRQKQYYRILNVPENSSYMFFTNLHPSVSFFDLPTELKSLDSKLLALEGFRYILFPQDMPDDLGPQQSFKAYIESEGKNSLRKVTLPGTHNTKAWQNPSPPAPHLMPVQDLVYVAGDSKDIRSYIDIPTKQQVAYYLAPEDTKMSTVERNNTILPVATKIYAIPDCMQCDPSKDYETLIQFPYTRYLPNSHYYPLIVLKEKIMMFLTKGEQKKFSLRISYSEKRIVEIQEMITQGVDHSVVIASALSLQRELESFRQSFTQKNYAIDDPQVLTSYRYFTIERKTLQDIIKQVKDPKEKQTINQLIQKLTQILTYLQSKIFISDNDTKRLVLHVPKSGTYRLLLKNDAELDTVQSVVALNGRQLQIPTEHDGFFDFGSLSLKKGTSLLSYHVHERSLLTKTADNLELPAGKTKLRKSFPLTSTIDPTGEYQIAFRFKLNPHQTLRVYVSDKFAGPHKDGLDGYVYNQGFLPDTSGAWKEAQEFFTPHYGVTDTTVHFDISGIGSRSAQVNDITVSKVVLPHFIFAYDTGRTLALPSLQYQEMNVGQYTVKITNASASAFLAFSEGFDEGWKAYLSDDTHALSSPIVGSYFNGNVREAAYRDGTDFSGLHASFIDPAVADRAHVPINTFANGWLLNRQGSYTIHLFFEPQKTFFLGLCVSFLVLVSLLVGYIHIRKKERSRS